MKHTREYRNSGKTRTPVELSKDFFLCGTGEDRGNFLTDNSRPAVSTPSANRQKNTGSGPEKKETSESEYKWERKKKKKEKMKEKNMITCSECTRRDLCQALKRDRLCNSYCWIHILLLKTLTSMPHYGNSWPSVCSPKASVGNLIEKASVRASDYRAAQLSARPVGPLVQPPPLSVPFSRPQLPPCFPVMYLLKTAAGPAHCVVSVLPNASQCEPNSHRP